MITLVRVPWRRYTYNCKGQQKLLWCQQMSMYTNISTQISWLIFTVMNLSQKLVQRMERLSACYNLNSNKFKITDRLLSPEYTLYFKNHIKCFYPLFSSITLLRSFTIPMVGRKKFQAFQDEAEQEIQVGVASESCENSPEIPVAGDRQHLLQWQDIHWVATVQTLTSAHMKPSNIGKFKVLI